MDTFDSYEMNNSFADASIISLNTDVRGKIEGGGDKDYFKFTTSKAGIIEISVNPVPSDIRLTARLYDAQQNHINSRTSQEAGSSIFFSTTTDTGGVYYLKLEGEYSSSDSDEPYTVNVKLK
ncbi:hypothetical protein DENIS_2817 [Desulfonema ishimotonii]|uniref:Peptidase C-terminal archaeal/bacterial domain-containing protein n=1 Tax=Desulfonema ishimotonii TaxID=45657 RepID=A0A401FY11_9BACT|nr:hypothetical protein [Desulfonema ishimotonii]GBC61855.1 hypothetical protein DENIS_2817 [Desulfonema ishimotonii]